MGRSSTEGVCRRVGQPDDSFWTKIILPCALLHPLACPVSLLVPRLSVADLFAPNRLGLTALACASNECLEALMERTRRNLRESVVSIVCARREVRRYEQEAAALKVAVEAALPGLRVELRPLSMMGAGEEGCSGSFEVVWEAFEWKHSRLLHSRLATGKTPQAGAIVNALLQHIVGWGVPATELPAWHARIIAGQVAPEPEVEQAEVKAEVKSVVKLPPCGTKLQRSITAFGAPLGAPPSLYRPLSRPHSLPNLLNLGGPVSSRTRATGLGQLFTPDVLLKPLLGKLDPSKLALPAIEQKSPPSAADMITHKLAALAELPSPPSHPASSPPLSLTPLRRPTRRKPAQTY